MTKKLDLLLLPKGANTNEFSSVVIHEEAKDYFGLEYIYNNKRYIQRTSKVTPKKIGQFVTLWKRNSQGITCPYTDKSEVDFLIIKCSHKKDIGYFKFSKQTLIDRGIISLNKDGKRGFRVYPRWDKPNSKQALNTQKWQLQNFSNQLILD